MSDGVSPDRPQPMAGNHRISWWILAFILGLYLTARGYHSFDGDQAYRLPLLLHYQEPRLFADDSFVRAFDTFNPHRGSIIVLDLATRTFGLPAGLSVLFVMTFGFTCRGVDLLARGVWPKAGPAAGLAAVGLVLAAKAGNIGTNHLFEAMVLDRLMAFALGWLALAHAVVKPEGTRWPAIAAVGAATWIHPSVGLQLAMVLAASWAVWLLLGRWTGIKFGAALAAILGMAVAVLPGVAVNLAPGRTLFGSMPADLFWLLSVELQSPQHMLPHLWRMPQWLGCASYLALASLAILNPERMEAKATNQPCSQEPDSTAPPAARLRLAVMLAIILVGLAVAWFAIEVLHNVRVTVFQPFRMATVARGIALVFLSGRVVTLWRTGTMLGRIRAILICVSVAGDWLMVVVTVAEIAVSATGTVRSRLARHPRWRTIDAAVYYGMLLLGLNFLAHHDTEYGHIPLLISVALGLSTGLARSWKAHANRRARWTWSGSQNRLRIAVVAAWVVPILSFASAGIPADLPLARSSLVRNLINRCRLMPVPVDDVERLAVWCRHHTPENARFIGPPGPKTFRLWSRRSLAFNRAASPYQAVALADWFARFSDHVDFHGDPAGFVRAYVADRHGFEARYDQLGPEKQAALARRQRADHVIALAPETGQSDHDLTGDADPLELLHMEGRYAVYRVKPAQLVQRQR